MVVISKIYVVEDLDRWCSDLRSSAGEGSKQEFTDPSIAVTALSISLGKIVLDLRKFGLLFECLCISDLRAYSESLGGMRSYYRATGWERMASFI